MGGSLFFGGEKMIAKISDLADVQGGIVLSRKEAKNQKESVFEYSRLSDQR